jgi:hypothetical protein
LSDSDRQRFLAVNRSFDRLPDHLRRWIDYLPFRLADDFILRGRKAVEEQKRLFEDSGGKWYIVNDGNGRN